MAQKNLFVFLGAYGSEADARADYDVVKELHLAGAVGTYDAAVITKDADGKVHVDKDELPTRHGAWTGIAAGALLGIIFPRRSSARPRSAAPPAASSATSGTACPGATSRSSARASRPA